MSDPGASCPRCGKTRPAGAVFCPSCGFNFAGETFSQRYGSQAPIALGVTRSRRSWSGLILLILGVALAGAIGLLILLNQKVSAPPVVSATREPVPTYRAPATITPEFTSPPEEYAARLGEGVDIINTDTSQDLGVVTVVSARRLTKVGYVTVDKGKVWLAARVRYAAAAPFDFSLFDWVAHDQSGTQYGPSGFGPDPELESGTLAKGRKADGWVPFEVPAATKALWVDYQPGENVIFSVKVYP